MARTILHRIYYHSRLWKNQRNRLLRTGRHQVNHQNIFLTINIIQYCIFCSHKFSVWAWNMWNPCDAAVIIFFLIGLSLRLRPSTKDIGRVIYCVDSIYWYLRILNILGVNKYLGKCILFVTNNCILIVNRDYSFRSTRDYDGENGEEYDIFRCVITGRTYVVRCLSTSHIISS